MARPSVGTVYDTLHFPDDFEISVGRPAEAYKMELKERFPDSAAGIDAYFEALLAARDAMRLILPSDRCRDRLDLCIAGCTGVGSGGVAAARRTKSSASS